MIIAAIQAISCVIYLTIFVFVDKNLREKKKTSLENMTKREHVLWDGWMDLRCKGKVVREEVDYRDVPLFPTHLPELSNLCQGRM